MKRLNRAVQMYGADKVSVQWKPYQLDSSFPETPMKITSFYERKFGPTWFEKYQRVIEEGRKEGAQFANWKWRCNTLKSLQLVEFARQHGVDTSTTKASLFEALYEEGKDVSDMNVLLGLASEKLGLSSSTEEIREYLESREAATDVLEEMAKGKREYNIRGVPFFVLQGSAKPFTISGAHAPETFLEIFDEFEE